MLRDPCLGVRLNQGCIEQEAKWCHKIYLWLLSSITISRIRKEALLRMPSVLPREEIFCRCSSSDASKYCRQERSLGITLLFNWCIRIKTLRWSAKIKSIKLSALCHPRSGDQNFFDTQCDYWHIKYFSVFYSQHYFSFLSKVCYNATKDRSLTNDKKGGGSLHILSLWIIDDFTSFVLIIQLKMFHQGLLAKKVFKRFRQILVKCYIILQVFRIFGMTV